MDKKWCWSYRLVSRFKTDNWPPDEPDIIGHIVMSTKCGVTVATELSNRYESHYVYFLNCLGEIDES